MLALGKPTAIFLLNGGSVAVFAELAAPNAAVVEAFYPGAAGAEALAKTLFGDANAWGKLPYTLYSAEWAGSHSMLEHNPAADARTYRYGTHAPLRRFGYGESYSRFSLRLAAPAQPNATLKTDGSGADLACELHLTNAGPLAGDQVVQAYLRPLDVPLATHPVETLVGFERVRDLAVGAAATVRFKLNARDLLLVTAAGDRVSAPGAYELRFWLGTDEGDAQAATLRLTLAGEQHVYERFPQP